MANDKQSNRSKTGEAGGKGTNMTPETTPETKPETEPKVRYSIVEKRSEKPEKGIVEILKQLTTQKQPVLNLVTGGDDTIEVKQCRFIPQSYDVSLHNSPAEYQDALFEAAKSLVQPAEKQTDALFAFAESEVYANSKKNALAAGDFMTQELKTQLVKMLRMRPKFADQSAKEVFDAWSGGFAKKNAKAIEFLEQAKTLLGTTDEEDFGF